MTNDTAPQVIGDDGLKGTLISPIPPLGSNETVQIRLSTGQTIAVPFSQLRAHAPGIYRVSPAQADLQQSGEPTAEATDTAEQVVIPVLSEELHIQKRAYPTGGVRVHRQTEEHDELVEVPLLKQTADVRRVVVGREVNGPLPVRYEGETTIVPVVEETLVVTKRFVLKEEIHITRTTREEMHEEQVTLRRQTAEVERLDENGDPVSTMPYVAPEEDDRPFAPIRTSR